MYKFITSIITIAITSATISGCSGPKAKIDMKTDVEVVQGQEPMKLGEVLQPVTHSKTAQIINIPPSKNCKMIRASGKSKVVNVTTYEGGNAKTLLNLVQHIKKWKNPVKPKAGYSILGYYVKNADITHVIVTETGYPITLLLSSHGDTLWVVHNAPGTQIEGINIVSHEGNSIIAPQLDPSKFKFLSHHYNDAVGKCWNKPERYFNAKEQSQVKPANYKRKPEDFAKYKKKEEAYKDWLNWIGRNIGRAHINIDREYRTEAVLIGPKPTELVPATEIGGVVLVDFPDGEPFWGTKKEAVAKFPPPPKQR